MLYIYIIYTASLSLSFSFSLSLFSLSLFLSLEREKERKREREKKRRREEEKERKREREKESKRVSPSLPPFFASRSCGSVLRVLLFYLKIAILRPELRERTSRATFLLKTCHSQAGGAGARFAY